MKSDHIFDETSQIDLNKSKSLMDFYVKEYDKIADAHFQVSQKITTFFQYAVLILSAPLSLFAVNDKIGDLIPYLFLCVGLVGFFTVMYLSSLRNESLLYARSVNQIRNEIYNLTKENINEKSIVMMTQKNKPCYFDGSQYIWIVVALGLLVSFYCGYSIWIIALNWWKWIGIFAGALVMALVIIVYYLQTYYAETGKQYYKQVLGVDIDGVLNQHDKNFVKFYNQLGLIFPPKTRQVENC